MSDVGGEIYRQLQAMGIMSTFARWGAREFVKGSDFLMFRVSGRGVGRSGKLKITLEPSDTYKVELFKIAGGSANLVQSADDVYVDNLREVIDDMLNESAAPRRAELIVEGLLGEAVGWPFERGDAKIWYFKSAFMRDLMMGYDFCAERGSLPDPKNLGKTHVLLGSMPDENLEWIFRMMQGENWSPNGEARGLISAKGLGHTSMSVGDVVQTPRGVFMVDGAGFRKLA